MDESIQKKLLSEIVEYGKYSFELELKREESLISHAAHMATVFSFSTAALYLLFQIALEHYKILTHSFLVTSVAIITVFLLLSLLFSIIATYRWKQDTLYSSKELYKFVKENEKHFIENDYAFVSEWNDVLSTKQERLYTLNNRRSVLVKSSIWCFLIALLIVFVFGIMAYVTIQGGEIDMKNNNEVITDIDNTQEELQSDSSVVSHDESQQNSSVLDVTEMAPRLGTKPTTNFTLDTPKPSPEPVIEENDE